MTSIINEYENGAFPMRKLFIFLAVVTFIGVPFVQADIGIGIHAGVSNYTKGLLPELQGLNHVPFGAAHFQMKLTAIFDFDINFGYGAASFTYRHGQDEGEEGIKSEEKIDFQDMGGGISIRYKFYQPDEKDIKAYAGGGFAVHLLTTESDLQTESIEYLDKKSNSGFFVVTGVNFKPNFLPVELMFEGTYCAFKLNNKTYGLSSIYLGFNWPLNRS